MAKTSKAQRVRLKAESGPMFTMVEAGVYLVHNTGVELGLVLHRPLESASEVAAKIIQHMRSGQYEDGDTYHLLRVDRRGAIGFEEFSGAEMDELLEKADLPLGP